jgi:hypothetical protein
MGLTILNTNSNDNHERNTPAWWNIFLKITDSVFSGSTVSSNKSDFNIVIGTQLSDYFTGTIQIILQPNYIS